MKLLTAVTPILAGIALLGATASAHHSLSRYDLSQEILIKGKEISGARAEVRGGRTGRARVGNRANSLSRVATAENQPWERCAAG